MESYVGVGVGVSVGVSVGVIVGVSVGVPVGVFVGEGVFVGVSVSVGVGVIPTPTSATLLIFSEFQKTCRTFELFVDAVGVKYIFTHLDAPLARVRGSAVFVTHPSSDESKKGFVLPVEANAIELRVKLDNPVL